MLAALFHRRPRLPVVPIPKEIQSTLFRQNPPFWARWVLVLVALDVMVSTSAIEYTWNCWTVAPDHKKDATNGTETSVSKSESDKPVLQPVWKRSAFCLLHFMSGCVVAGGILATRSRVVRSITISRPSTNPMVGHRLYLATAGHPLQHGYEIYVKRCKFVDWENRRISFEVKDRGRWTLDLRGASINGVATLSPSINYDSMMKAWERIRQRPSDIASTSKIPKKK